MCIVIDWVYVVGWMVVWVLLEFVVCNVFDIGVCYFVCYGGFEQLCKNLVCVLGVLLVVVLDLLMCVLLEFYGCYWCEVFWLLMMNYCKLVCQFDCVIGGLDYLDVVLVVGFGVVLVLLYSGNWDMVGMWLVQWYGIFIIVVECLKFELLYQCFIDYCESLGFEVLLLFGGEWLLFEVFCEWLRNN